LHYADNNPEAQKALTEFFNACEQLTRRSWPSFSPMVSSCSVAT